MTKIKICGLKRTEDISYVNELLPDFAGFVFAKSSRQVDAKKAAELKKQLSPKIKAVGVFVNAKSEFIAKLYQKQIIDLAQLHGDETADYIHRLKNLCPSLPLIKAVRVQSTKQILEAEKLPCDYLLLDTWQKDSYGGSGKTFDWTLLKNLPRSKKLFMLAGGLAPENVSNAIFFLHPDGVDVSSGVEFLEKDRPGKDPYRIQAFAEAVQFADKFTSKTLIDLN